MVGCFHSRSLNLRQCLFYDVKLEIWNDVSKSTLGHHMQIVCWVMLSVAAREWERQRGKKRNWTPGWLALETPMELWTWASPSELSRIQQEGSPYFSRMITGMGCHRQGICLHPAALLGGRQFLDRSSVTVLPQATLLRAERMSAGFWRRSGQFTGA